MARHSSQILDLARRGASVRLRELYEEIRSLVAQFPHLRDEIGGSYPVPEERVKRHPRRGRMSPAARKAASLRMKKYWAAKRAAGKK